MKGKGSVLLLSLYGNGIASTTRERKVFSSFPFSFLSFLPPGDMGGKKKGGRSNGSSTFPSFAAIREDSPPPLSPPVPKKMCSAMGGGREGEKGSSGIIGYPPAFYVSKGRQPKATDCTFPFCRPLCLCGIGKVLFLFLFLLFPRLLVLIRRRMSECNPPIQRIKQINQVLLQYLSFFSLTKKRYFVR